MKTDIVVDLAYGDCGKGKVTHHLLKGGEFTHCIRFNGSNNAGHTIYHKGQKLVTHLIPAGVFFDVRSVIGPGCVINVKSFFEEIEYLEKAGIPARKLIRIARNAHIVTDEHLAEEVGEDKIGTTRRGIGPAYRDKYARTGIRADSMPELVDFLVDFHMEINQKDAVLLCEGAQGFFLDPHFGDYPYVTSSHCGVAGALLNGISHRSIRNVYGVIKAYETYVGAKKFEGDDPVFKTMRTVGNEFGATTGRPRQCNYIDFTGLDKAININGITHLVVNKMDVLKELNCWKVRYNDGFQEGLVVDLFTEEEFKDYFKRTFPELVISFSYSPETV